MFIPLPLLILAGLVFLVLLVMAMRPRGRSDDLMAAPRPRVQRVAVPAGQKLELSSETRVEVERLLANGQVLDLDGGSVRPPTAGESFWCPEPQTFTSTDSWMFGDGSVRHDKRIEGEVLQCDQGGAPITGPPTAVPLVVSTVTDAALRMVATRSGVIAYRVPL